MRPKLIHVKRITSEDYGFEQLISEDQFDPTRFVLSEDFKEKQEPKKRGPKAKKTVVSDELEDSSI